MFVSKIGSTPHFVVKFTNTVREAEMLEKLRPEAGIFFNVSLDHNLLCVYQENEPSHIIGRLCKVVELTEGKLSAMLLPRLISKF